MGTWTEQRKEINEEAMAAFYDLKDAIAQIRSGKIKHDTYDRIVNGHGKATKYLAIKGRNLELEQEDEYKLAKLDALTAPRASLQAPSK